MTREADRKWWGKGGSEPAGAWDLFEPRRHCSESEDPSQHEPPRSDTEHRSGIPGRLAPGLRTWLAGRPCGEGGRCLGLEYRWRTTCRWSGRELSGWKGEAYNS